MMPLFIETQYYHSLKPSKVPVPGEEEARSEAFYSYHPKIAAPSSLISPELLEALLAPNFSFSFRTPPLSTT